MLDIGAPFSFNGRMKKLISFILLALVALASGCAVQPAPVKVVSITTVYGQIGAADEFAVNSCPYLIPVK